MKKNLITRLVLVAIAAFSFSTIIAQPVITTVVGSGAGPSAGDGGPATSAHITLLHAVAVDQYGNIYTGADARLRKTTRKTGIINTIAGNGTSEISGDGGSAKAAHVVFQLQGIFVDKKGDIYLSDHNRIRKITHSTGIISTICGKDTSENTGDGGLAINANIRIPGELFVDDKSNVFIVTAARVRKIDGTTGIITTVAGNGSGAASTGDGGPATSAGVLAQGIALDTAGNLYITEVSGNIRMVSAATGIITTIGSNVGALYGIRADNAGNLFFIDYNLGRVKKLNIATHTITLVAGIGVIGFGGDNGPVTSALFHNPMGLAVDIHNNLYIADYGNARVRKITMSEDSTYPDEPVEPNSVSTLPVTTFSITPNPAHTDVYISISGQPGGTLSIANQLGQLLYTQPVTKATEKVNIAFLPAGMYLLRLQNGSQVLTQKLVKE